jgi:Glycosyltransferase
LAARCHDVRAVMTPPFYPAWRVDEGYSAWRYQRESLSGVDVWRCPVWVPTHPTGVRRMLSQISYFLSSLPVMLWQIFWRPEVVIAIEPPLFCALQAWLVARLAGAKAWLHIQDFEVDVALRMGLLEYGALYSIVATMERWLMCGFDRVSTISEKMLERLSFKGVPPERRVLFTNWVDTERIYPLGYSSPMRSELGISKDTIVVLYSGNMGAKQGLEVMIEAARYLKDDSSVLFVLCGDGGERASLQAQAQSLPNVRFILLQSLEGLNNLLNMADIHILSQRADAADLVMPSKLTGMLASGRPVIATAKTHTQVAKVVEQCGIVVPPEDAQALTDAVRQLAVNPEARSQLGTIARDYALSHWRNDLVLLSFEEKLLSLRSCFKNKAMRRQNEACSLQGLQPARRARAKNRSVQRST